MNYAIKYSNELSHHGILGMHWGKKNGPPYPLDVQDYSAEEKRKAKKASRGKTDAYYWKAGKDGKASRGEKIIRTTGEVGKASIDTAKKVYQRTKEQPKKRDLSDKSDEELRKYINRKQLERQYNQLADDDVSVGKDEVEFALDIAGDVLATAISAATLYAVIKGAKFA